MRSWLVYSITDSELALGIVSLMVALSMLTLGPIGGVAADRFERRGLVAAGQATVVIAEAVVLFLLFSGTLDYWHILVQVAVVGAVFPFVMPARNAIVADVVGRRRLTNAMALSMTAVNVTRVVGPSVGGLLIGFAGVEVAYSVNAGLYVLALAAMMGVHRAPVANPVGAFDAPEHGPGLPLRRGEPPGSRAPVLRPGADVPGHAVPDLARCFRRGHLGGGAAWPWDAERRFGRRRGGGRRLRGLALQLEPPPPVDDDQRLRLRSVHDGLRAQSLVLARPSPDPGRARRSRPSTRRLNNTAIHVLIPDSVRGRVSGFLTMSFSLPMLGVAPISALAEVWGAPLAVGLSSLLAVVVATVFYLASSDLRRMDLLIRRAFRDAVRADAERPVGPGAATKPVARGSAP